MLSGKATYMHEAANADFFFTNQRNTMVSSPSPHDLPGNSCPDNPHKEQSKMSSLETRSSLKKGGKEVRFLLETSSPYITFLIFYHSMTSFCSDGKNKNLPNTATQHHRSLITIPREVSIIQTSPL